MEAIPARPVTAMFSGLIVGLSVAVILQQGGVWPLDKLTTFLLPGLLGLVFVLLSRVLRPTSAVPLAIALILLIAPLAYGLSGIGEAGERGQLNGGCTVEAASDLDTTVITDTSRSNPFAIDPDGGLSWLATSPGPITDQEWAIWVDISGYELLVADGGGANGDLITVVVGDVPDVRGYVEDRGLRALGQVQGVYQVGGFIDGESGSCDGLGFVKVEGGFFGSIASWVALALGVLALGVFWVVAFTDRFRPLPEGRESAAQSTDHVVIAGAAGDRTTADGDGAAPIGAGELHPAEPFGGDEVRPPDDRSD